MAAGGTAADAMAGKPIRRGLRLFTAAWLLLVTAYAVWVLLDTFVIRRTLGAVEPAPIAPIRALEPAVTDTSYDDGDLCVTITTMRAYGSTVYLADVTLTDAARLSAALAENTYGRNITQTVAEMARAQDAVLAINGDYYGSQRTGYVLRNGVVYRAQPRSEDQQDLCLWPDGTMTVIREGDVPCEELASQGAWQVLAFGPALVVDGEIAVSEGDEVGRAKASNPRTAVAMLEPLHYLFVVSDGRTEESEGLSLTQLARLLQAQGARLAYNLDGGGSSTMVFMGRVINFPTTNGRYSERAVSDIVYVR